MQKLCRSANKLGPDFYSRENVVQIAGELLGKILVTNFDNKLTAARIAETEAYNGIIDKASHAYGGRRTKRTEIMYRAGGTAYVYLCYGIHHLFNVVTNAVDIPHAVLIRAAEPVAGIDIMLARTGKTETAPSLTSGPGNITGALGISTRQTGISLLDETIYIVDDGFIPGKNDIAVSPRIGVGYAGEDAFLPYRFYLKGNLFVSGKQK